MYPYTPLARKQVQPSRCATADSSISLLFANVLMTNRRSGELRRLIREQDPDVILAVETDVWWEAELAEFERTHKHFVKQPQANTYGMLLYSRLELRNAQVKFLVQDDVPSIHAAVVLRSGEQVELRCVHPRPPAPQENDRSTERDAEILVVGKEIKGKQAPAIVLGDLNDVAWSRTNDLFHNISGLLDPRVGRGFFATFNAKWPLIRFPLDHVFHSPHFRLLAFSRLARCGSDHFPVYIKLSFEPEATQSQEQPRATAEEHREAQEKIAEAGG
jgi:endonuclease/exonuclease/phosphatase (EEP) superfamily protein YafD